MHHLLPALLVEEEFDADRAVTAVLSGRADLVARPGPAGAAGPVAMPRPSRTPDHGGRRCPRPSLRGPCPGRRTPSTATSPPGTGRAARSGRSWARRSTGAPDAPALIERGRLRLTYAELLARADATAARLVGLGLGPGDRIVVQLANGWEFVVLTLACLRAGIVPVMALPAHRRAELSYLAAHAEAAAIAVPDVLRGFDHQAARRARGRRGRSGTACRARLAPAPRSRPGTSTCAPCAGPSRTSRRPTGGTLDGCHTSRDVAVFLLSGGTTGPAEADRPHPRRLRVQRPASAAMCGVDADTVYLVSLPAGHNFPLACPGILGTLLRRRPGGHAALARAGAGLRDDRAPSGVTHTAVVPAVAGRWLEHAAEHAAPTSSPACACCRSAAPGWPTSWPAGSRPVLGAQLQQVFGMAEGLLNYTRLDDPDEVVCTTQGRPMSPDDEVRLVDELDQRRPGRRARLAAHPRPLHPARLLPRRGAERPRLHRRRLVPHRRHLPPHAERQPGRRGPGQGHDQPRRREDLRRGGREPGLPAARRRARSPPSRCPTPSWASGCASTSSPGPAPRSPSTRCARRWSAAGVARFKLPERLVLVDELARHEGRQDRQEGAARRHRPAARE